MQPKYYSSPIIPLANLCYTDTMDSGVIDRIEPPNPPHIWREWAAALQSRGWGELAAAVLEATLPLHLAGAQALYIGQPFLSGLLPGHRIKALASLLEDDHAVHALLTYLREENP